MVLSTRGCSHLMAVVSTLIGTSISTHDRGSPVGEALVLLMQKAAAMNAIITAAMAVKLIAFIELLEAHFALSWSWSGSSFIGAD